MWCLFLDTSITKLILKVRFPRPWGFSPSMSTCRVRWVAGDSIVC